MATTPITRFLVIGCGHTGTTLVSGILHINGYGSFNVSRLFENLSLNALNRGLLAGKITGDNEVRAFLAEVERRTGGRWSLKDPRLCETAPVFYRNLEHPVKIICNFRDPGATVRSLRREREIHEPHLSPEEMQRAAEEEYLTRTRAALRFLDDINRNPVLYVRYDDLIDRRSDDALSRFVGHPLDMTFIEPAKSRSTPIPVSDAVLGMHAEMERRYAANRQTIIESSVPVRPGRVGRGRSLRTQFFLQSNRIANKLRRIAGSLRVRSG